ncbi:hypothetical protein [Bradyrhizobium sp. USDA 4451]
MNSPTVRIAATPRTAQWIKSSYDAYFRAVTKKEIPILSCPDELKPDRAGDTNDRLWVITVADPSRGHIIDWHTMMAVRARDRRICIFLVVAWIAAFYALVFVVFERGAWITILAFSGLICLSALIVWFAAMPNRRIVASLTRVEFPIELSQAIKRTARRKQVFSTVGKIVGSIGGLAASGAVRAIIDSDGAAKVAEELSKALLEAGGEVMTETLAPGPVPSTSKIGTG